MINKPCMVYMSILQIKVHANLPVGKNLQDHVMSRLPFFPNVSLVVTKEKMSSLFTRLQWYLFGTGTCTFKN